MFKVTIKAAEQCLYCQLWSFNSGWKCDLTYVIIFRIMHTLKTWVKLCKDMKKLSLHQSCLIDKFRKYYKTLLVIALFFPENINNDNNKNEKKIRKWKKDNKVSLKQQQQHLGAPFDNLKRVSTTLCEEFFSISMEIRKRFW